MNPALIDPRGRPSLIPPPPVACSSSRVAAPANLRPSWWMWPHLLSLDAPLVALVWQRWWSHSAGMVLPWTREWILGLGVWLIYLADRLADTADRSHDGPRVIRHTFSRWHRRLLVPLAGLVALSLVLLTFGTLPTGEFRPGLLLLTLAIGYFWLIHCWPGHGWAAYLPKEAVVGAMFGAGSIFFVVCRVPHLSGEFWTASVLFSVVCFLNCALITNWEQQAQDVDEQSSLLNAFPRFSAHLRGACLALAAVSVAISAATASWLALPVAMSALLLAGLDRLRPKISVDTLRVCADLVLLTPVIIWIGTSF